MSTGLARRSMCHRVLCGVGCALLPAIVTSVSATAAWAQGPSARARVEPPEVNLGGEFRLVVDVSGVQRIDSVALPSLEGFATFANYRRLVTFGAVPGTAQAGQLGGSVTLTLLLSAIVPGSFEVGPFRITADGQSLETNPVTLLVGGPEGSELEVRARVNPSRVNVGDEFELSVEVRGAMSRGTEFIPPDVFDFAEYAGPARGSESRFDWEMRAVVPGEFEIPPVRVVIGGQTFESEPVRLVVTDEPRRVDVEATLRSQLIWVGGEFLLGLDISGVAELDEEPVLPDMSEFAELALGESPLPFTVRVVGPEAVQRAYRLRALAAGDFEIGPVRISADGRTFTTEPISLVIVDVPTGDADPPEDLFVTASADKLRAYVNEPVIVTYKVLSGGDIRDQPAIGTMSWPALDGFDVSERTLPRFRREQTFIGDRGYQAIPLRRVLLLPRQEGQVDLGAATVEAQLRDRGPFGINRGPGGEPSGEPETSSVILTSDPVTLEVLPLPAKGRPASFRGHVGELDVASWVNRNTVEIGDTVTLEVEVSAEGYMMGLPNPEIDFPAGFEVSEPRIRSAIPVNADGLRGTRTYIYQLVARAEGSYGIPAVEMSYFDAESASYGTSRTGSFTVTVVAVGGEAR